MSAAHPWYWATNLFYPTFQWWKWLSFLPTFLGRLFFSSIYKPLWLLGHLCKSQTMLQRCISSLEGLGNDIWCQFCPKHGKFHLSFKMHPKVSPQMLQYGKFDPDLHFHFPCWCNERLTGGPFDNEFFDTLNVGKIMKIEMSMKQKWFTKTTSLINKIKSLELWLWDLNRKRIISIPWKKLQLEIGKLRQINTGCFCLFSKRSLYGAFPIKRLFKCKATFPSLFQSMLPIPAFLPMDFIG